MTIIYTFRQKQSQESLQNKYLYLKKQNQRARNIVNFTITLSKSNLIATAADGTGRVYKTISAGMFEKPVKPM